MGDARKIALKLAKSLMEKIRLTGIVNIPQTEGILPFIQIFAGLRALGH